MVKHGQESCEIADKIEPEETNTEDDTEVILAHMLEALEAMHKFIKEAVESSLNILVAQSYNPDHNHDHTKQRLDILNEYIDNTKARVTIKPSDGRTLLMSLWQINKQTKKAKPKGSDELKESQEFSGDYFEWSKQDNLIYLCDKSAEVGVEPFRKVRLSMTDSTRDYLVVSVTVPVAEEDKAEDTEQS